MIEPLRELLQAGMQSDRQEIDERWPTSLAAEVKEARVEMRAVLTETELTLGDVMGLRAGDVIPIDLPRHVTARVEGVPVFRAQYGVSRGSNALKILSRISHDEPKRST
jgi:flagellar motor switch protein FliM